MVQDKIEREISIAAPVERVWEVVTEPEHLSTWFGSDTGKPVEVDHLRPGGGMVVDHGEFGVFPLKIETFDPPKLFAYRWASGFPGAEVTDANSTLVEFILRSEDGGTLLRIVETGFTALPAEVAELKYEENGGGWTGMAERVKEYTEGL
ncbi:SRPBCC family protein [Actinomadura sp. 9N407]|uniref:SRPBCC family protein n=1 Tax=Actinomadura sp. 9N407 TaxID=3375154 RepID=UPI0037A4D415